MKHLLYILGLLVLVACSSQLYPLSKSQSSFYKQMQQHCGKSYAGKVVFPESDKDPFAGKALSMHITSCADTAIRVPFWVGDDKSRTWVISKTQQGLQLKHDHRHEDGTPDEITMYGGMATSTDNSMEVSFPADAHTAQLIPAAATNEWTLAFSPDGKTFSYILKRDNQLRFRADFNLTKPL